ncbi:MAG TPA: divalent-cation tolerance protein CutA [Candidatus Dormibacteraeota bacterium]|jgi:periplasmic divalent cation tolerance protein
MKDGRAKRATESADRPVLIMVTAGGRNDAERIGEGLVEGRMAACCTVIPTVHSFYYEDGQLKREHESLLLIKTVESRAKAVEEYVLANHSYDVPEILQVAIESGSPAYLLWLADQVSVTNSDRPANT